MWAKGWSWKSNHRNQWTLGPDGAAGKANVDDDADGVTDEESDLGEIGKAGSDDVSLDVNQNRILDSSPITDIEQDAQTKETNAEHSHARADWGNPGKNHKTID